MLALASMPANEDRAKLNKVVRYAVPAGEDSTGQAMVKMRRALIDEVRA